MLSESDLYRGYRRKPHAGDPIVLYGERRTILELTDRGSGPLVVADDEAGLRIERRTDRLVWDAELGAWR